MLEPIKRFVAGSLRHKLLVLVFLPVLLVAPATVGFVIYWSRNFSYDQLLMQVKSDLTVAYDAFSRTQRDYLRDLETLANSYAFQSALEKDDQAALSERIQGWKETGGFDFLHLTDLKGRWLLASGDDGAGHSRPSPLIRKAAQRGTPSVGMEVFPPESLRREGGGLAERAALSLVDTPRAEPTGREVEERALVVRAVYPVRDVRGSLVALLDGGVLLNRNHAFVDAIRDLVYGAGSLPEGSIGTVTVLLGDVRISTNVPLQAGRRALGTRVSREVRERVLGRGDTWVDRAFVVDDWYISGYEPIVDVYGERVGMLYTGFLEAPFRSAYHQTLGVLLALLGLGTGVAVVAATWGASSISRPIEALASVVRATRAGEERRIGPVASRDEIGQLARQFDEMLDLLQRRNEQIRQAADELESKVEQRTQELTEKNQRLQETIKLLHQTERQLVAAEKMAALGQLTAGVAHEINNPIAVIQGNLEVLRAELGEHADAVATEVDLVFEQVDRIRAIVDKLLVYSRPRSASQAEEVRVREVVDDTLVLAQHAFDRKRVQVERDYAETNGVAIDRRELQQVLVNLLLNATHAVSGGGRVEVATRDHADGVVIRVSDDGVGIPEEYLGRIFDPFFTTKKEEGTGLGLSISHSLIRRHGGDIRVHSQPGEGTVFEIFLRRMAEPGGEVAPFRERDRYLDLSV